MKPAMGLNRKFLCVLLALTSSIALVACGGGGGGSSTVSPGTGSATVQGSVPGTVFIAVNHDTDTEAGRATAPYR